MGSMWLDPPEDAKTYPMQGQPPLAFDPTMLTDAKTFPETRWGADFKSLLWLMEFSTIKGWRPKVRYGIPDPPAADSQDTIDQLKDLVQFQHTLREQALPEILAQNTEFQFYFCAQLSCYPRSHPMSYRMLKSVARIGEMVMVYLKASCHAVRPSQIYPRLTPPVAVPQHSSYPSGHALIGHLMAHMAKAIMPSLGNSAYVLARRIARNREIAGLHFQRDSKAGEIAARNTFALISAPDQITDYKQFLQDAKKEWT